MQVVCEEQVHLFWFLTQPYTAILNAAPWPEVHGSEFPGEPTAGCHVQSRGQPGSYHSWEDLPSAFLEVNRVLRPGGMTYIGGGYGSARIRDEVYANRREHGILDYPAYSAKTRFRKFSTGEIETLMETARISDYRIISDDSGFWIIFRKNKEQTKGNVSATGKTISMEHLLHFPDGFFFTE